MGAAMITTSRVAGRCSTAGAPIYPWSQSLMLSLKSLPVASTSTRRRLNTTSAHPGHLKGYERHTSASKEVDSFNYRPRRIVDVDSHDLEQLRGLLDPTSSAHGVLDQLATDQAFDANQVCFPPTFPTSIRQCLTTYLPPNFKPPSDDRSSSSIPAPKSSMSTNLARVFAKRPTQTIGVADSSQLQTILWDTVTKAFTSDPDQGRARLRAWRRIYTSSWEVVSNSAIPYEEDQSGLSLLYLATPLNDLLGDPSAYRADASLPHPPPKWTRPSTEYRVGVTDWICYAGNKPVGTVEWKRRAVLMDADVQSFATHARQYGRMQKRFEVIVVGGDPESRPKGLSPNAAKAILQIWSECHHYKTRWALLYNTQWYCIVYLASTFEILISHGIPPESTLDGETLTVAAALAAIALCPPAPDGCDSDKDIRFLTLPLEGPQRISKPTSASPAAVSEAPFTPIPLVPTKFRRANRLDSPATATTESIGRLVIGHPIPGGQGRVWTTYAAKLHGPSDAEILVIQWESTKAADTVARLASRKDPSEDSMSSINMPPATPSILSLEHTASTPLSTATEFRDVVVKLCHPAGVHLDVEEDRQTLVGCIMNEADLFDGPLRELQGRVVPEYYGLYEGFQDAGTDPVYLAMMEPAGNALVNKWSDFHGATRMQVSRAYQQLHAAGVWHGDLAARHVRAKDDRIVIIDFDQSRMASPASLASEQEAVDRYLILR